jgi:hypothetical protein
MNVFSRFFVFPAVFAVLFAGVAPASADEKAPAALVEAVANAPDAGVGFLDYVYPGKVIDLGSGGTLTLAYFDTCLTETITGGKVTVARGASEVEGGEVSTKKVPCQGGRMVVTAETSEAGATVSRVTPFAGQDWAEYTLKTPNPLFKWPAADGAATLKVLFMDAEPPKVVWESQVQGSHLAYPADAPALEIGYPYQVQVTRPDAPLIAAMFSVDPDLDVPDTVMARVVPLGR